MFQSTNKFIILGKLIANIYITHKREKFYIVGFAHSMEEWWASPSFVPFK